MALRTNSKKAVQNLKDYVMRTGSEYFSEFFGNGCGLPHETPEAVLWSIMWCFHKETTAPYTEASFERWTSGLPCGSVFDYYLCEGKETLGAILEETPTERDKYCEVEAEMMLTKLIYREAKKSAFCADWCVKGWVKEGYPDTAKRYLLAQIDDERRSHREMVRVCRGEKKKCSFLSQGEQRIAYLEMTWDWLMKQRRAID